MTEVPNIATGNGLSSLVLTTRGRATDRDFVIATLTARMQLLAGFSSPELFVHVAGGSAPEQTLAQLTGTAGAPLGGREQFSLQTLGAATLRFPEVHT